jgi:hypothetical protein
LWFRLELLRSPSHDVNHYDDGLGGGRVNDVTVFNRLEITPHRFFTPKKNEVEKKPVSTFFRSPVRPPPPPAVCQFLHFHFYPPVRAPVRPPPPVSAPPPNPVHPPQPPPLAPPRTLDPPLPVPSPAARLPGGLKPSPLPSMAGLNSARRIEGPACVSVIYGRHLLAWSILVFLSKSHQFSSK